MITCQKAFFKLFSGWFALGCTTHDVRIRMLRVTVFVVERNRLMGCFEALEMKFIALKMSRKQLLILHVLALFLILFLSHFRF